MSTKRNAVDKRLLVLGLIGLLVFIWMSWEELFVPNTATISRDTAIVRAQELWQKQGVDVGALERSAILRNDTMADGYVGSNKGHDEFAEQAPPDAPLMIWSVTFYESTGDRSYSAGIDLVNGTVVSYQRTDVQGASTLPRQQAEQIATTALRNLGLDPDQWERVATASGTKSHQEIAPDLQVSATSATPEHVFEWKVPGATYHDMRLFYQVGVTGEHVTSLKYIYDVPPSFQDWQKQQQSIGSLLTIISFGLSVVLYVLALVFVFLIKQPKPYSAALWLSLLVLVLFLFSNLNSLSTFQHEYVQAGAGLLERTFGNLLMIGVTVVLALLVAGATYPTLLTGGMLTREINPRLWTPAKSPEWPNTMRGAVWNGYLLAFLWLALQAIFYWLGETYFGVWAENDVTLSPANTWFPALFPLMGWMAGVQEEITYRLFGVTFFKRYLRSSLVATLIPGMIWALGHSLYPIYPIYTRFIELTLFGILIGYCYLWYGIETVIFAHAIFDIVQMALPLVLSGELGMGLSGSVFLITPIIVGYMLIYLHRIFNRRLQMKEVV